jgi:hypothetical protein
MIAALIGLGIPVEVADTSINSAFVVSLGRDLIGQHYEGGQGWTGSKSDHVGTDAITHVAMITPETCDAYQNWQAAMEDTDRLASQESPATAAALEIEANAFYAFVDYIHAHSIPRQNVAHEITPFSPVFYPEMVMV